MDDQVLFDQEEKQEAVLDFYENLLGTAEEREYTIDLDAIGVQQHDLSTLDCPFSEEVWATIKGMPLDKAPGPDGFTGRFYKTCWNIIKGDIMLALEAIQRGHVFKFKLLNTAFITLLPKKPDAVFIKDFGPINLIHSFAKLVTKVMAKFCTPDLLTIYPAVHQALRSTIHLSLVFRSWTQRKVLFPFLTFFPSTKSRARAEDGGSGRFPSEGR